MLIILLECPETPYSTKYMAVLKGWSRFAKKKSKIKSLFKSKDVYVTSTSTFEDKRMFQIDIKSNLSISDMKNRFPEINQIFPASLEFNSLNILKESTYD